MRGAPGICVVSPGISTRFDRCKLVHALPIGECPTAAREIWVEWGIVFGSFGWFCFWFLLFCKVLPAIAIAEVKEMIPAPVRGPMEAK